jgi:hypothetical protein
MCSKESVSYVRWDDVERDLNDDNYETRMRCSKRFAGIRDVSNLAIVRLLHASSGD